MDPGLPEQPKNDPLVSEQLAKEMFSDAQKLRGPLLPKTDGCDTFDPARNLQLSRPGDETGQRLSCPISGASSPKSKSGTEALFWRPLPIKSLLDKRTSKSLERSNDPLRKRCLLRIDEGK